MKWFFWAGLASLGIALQTTIAPRAALFGVRPDWMFCLVVFFSLHLPRWEACLLSWILGLLVDMMSIERLGLMASLYLASALVVTATRHLIFVRRPLAHFFVTFGTYFLVFTGTYTYRWVAYDWTSIGARPWFQSAMGYAFCTALWAPLIVYGLLRVHGALEFNLPRGVHARPREFVEPNV